MSTTRVVPLQLRSGVALALASAVGLLGFLWPFFVEPGAALDSSHSGDAPYLFVAILPLLAAIVLAELTAGGLDAKAVAMLGMLSAVGGALRALGPGMAGIEPSFALVILGGRVFGRGFGFVLGATTMFTGALITGGVGPWLPFQMMTAAWVGFLAGSLPRLRGRAEVALLAAYGAVAGLAFGMVMNIWFWPFVSYAPEVSYVTGAPLVENLGRYALFYVTTSLLWDAGRAVVTAGALLVAGTALLRALRRAGRRAAFGVPVAFER